MDAREKAELFRITAGRITFDAPMKQRTTFRIGGNADALYDAPSLEDLRRMLAYLRDKEIPSLVIGRGSNLLVREGGIRGVVIRLSEAFGRIEWGRPDNSRLLVGAGASIADLLIGCRRSGLSGLEFLAGIPGTVGGAVRMNAGAFGSEIGSWVREIRRVDPHGGLHVMDRSRMVFSYRSLEVAKGSIILQVEFRLNPKTGKEVAQRIGDCLKRRKGSQPLADRSAGSVFKNPPHEYAGRLIEEAGLKGRRIGGAMISDRHANFIVNTGGATAGDVLSLMELAREAVMRTTGIVLKPELHVVGESDDEDSGEFGWVQ